MKRMIQSRSQNTTDWFKMVFQVFFHVAMHQKQKELKIFNFMVAWPEQEVGDTRLDVLF